MSEKKPPTIVKYYCLTSKAWRHILALEEYEKAQKRISKLSDEEVMKLAKEKHSIKRMSTIEAAKQLEAWIERQEAQNK